MKIDITNIKWKRLEKYKVDEDTYDFKNAPIEDILYLYKLLGHKIEETYTINGYEICDVNN